MIIVLMGVSGSGKTTVGRLLAAQLGCVFHDADRYHPAGNIEKMRNGRALTDEERAPWLDSLRELLHRSASQAKPTVLACSALKESYRRKLRMDEQTRFVYLKGEFSLIEDRLRRRTGHFMGAGLLRSQFETLEEPQGDVLVVDAAMNPAEIVRLIREELAL